MLDEDTASVPPPVVSMRLISEPASNATDPGRPGGAAALFRGQFLGPRRPGVHRMCHVHISNLSLEKPLSRHFSHFCISARIRGEKGRSLLVSGPISAPNASDIIPLDLWFSLSYMHRLKGPANMLQIALHRCKEDGRNSQLQCRVDLPMDYILQKPFKKPTQLQLFANKQCIAIVESMAWSARPANDSLDHKANSATEGQVVPMLDDPSSTSASSAVSEATELSTTGREHSPDLIDESKNASNALLRLRPAIYSKMKLVRQSGSKMIDRLKHNLRRRSISSSDDDIANRDEAETGIRKPDHVVEVDSFPEHEPHIDDAELLNSIFSDVPTQIVNVSSSFSNDPSSLPNTIIFIDRNCQQSRQLLEWSSRASTKSVLSVHRIVFFSDCHEAESLFVGLTSLYKQTWQSSSSLGDQLRIGIAGDDASVTMILRPFVQLMAQDPRSWLALKFNIIPLNPQSSEHHISEKIASLDAQYRVLFRSSAWENVLDGKTVLIEPIGRQIEESISHFMLKADSVYRLPIAEAMIEVVDDDPEVNGTAVSVPLIRDFSIIDIDYGPDFQQQQNANALFPVLKAPKPVVIEYWAVDQRVGKVSKSTLKTTFSTTRVFRLDILASEQSAAMQLGDQVWADNGSETDPHSEITAPSESVHQSVSAPPLPDESLHMLIRLMPKDKNKFLQRFGAYSPKKASGHSLHYERNEIISKFVCSAPHDAKFTACLDGLTISGCKFASLTPLWPTRIKSFPVAMFKN